MKIIVASMIRNEADRFLVSALRAWKSFADEILIIDDHSEDESVLVCQAEGVEVLSSTLDEAWGKETPLRAALWEKAYERTEPNDWIFILDADMVPARNPRQLLQSIDSTAVAFTLYDLWTEYSDGLLLYREDSFWQGHLNPRVWAVRNVPTPESGWLWGGRGIHCGHLPHNYDVERLALAPQEYSLLHYAYVDNDLRIAKFRQYQSVKNQLSETEWNHARSILDPMPKLKTLPFAPELRLEYSRS